MAAGVGVGEAPGLMLGGVVGPVSDELGVGVAPGGRDGPDVDAAVGEAAPMIVVPGGDDGLGEPTGWAPSEFTTPSTKMTPATAPTTATMASRADGRRLAGVEEGTMAHNFCRAASLREAIVLPAAGAF